MKDLARLALDTALSRGADYADVRLVRYRSQNIGTEDRRVSSLSDTEDVGIGVRAIANGAWGFSGTCDLSPEGVQACAADAVAIARASAIVGQKPVSLVPEPPATRAFRTPYQIDPFAVPIEEKVGLLLEINERLLANRGVRKAHGFMTLRKADRMFLSSEGSDLESEVVTTNATYSATAVGDGDARSRSYEPPPLTMGYENIDREDLLANTERVAEEAVEHLRAPECEPCVTDLVLDPVHLSLTIHESVGHATELDRALGMEESLAGRSFAVPSLLRNLKYGSDLVTFRADNTLEHGLATHGFDDEGVAGQAWNIVEDGLFVGYGTSREVAGEVGLERSTGSCRADHWGSIPIVRIPNLSLMPGKVPCSPDEIIADTKRGIYIEGRGSFSIDQMRCNFQFGGDAFWEIRDGKRVRMLKNVTYQSMTTDFWNSIDAIADERFWHMGGVLNCGKGDPMQISQMTHGAATVRVRNVQVGAAAGVMRKSS
jgi:TldD protein